MQVPNMISEPFVKEDRHMEKGASNMVEQLLQNLQRDFGVTLVPPQASGSQLTQLASTYGQQDGIQLGCLVFDPTEVNGGSMSIPNGQLKIFLGDGSFHKITNS